MLFSSSKKINLCALFVDLFKSEALEQKSFKTGYRHSKTIIKSYSLTQIRLIIYENP